MLLIQWGPSTELWGMPDDISHSELYYDSMLGQ